MWNSILRKAFRLGVFLSLMIAPFLSLSIENKSDTEKASIYNKDEWYLLYESSNLQTEWLLNKTKIQYSSNQVKCWIKQMYSGDERIMEAKRQFDISVKFNQENSHKWLSYSYSMCFYEFDLSGNRFRCLSETLYSKDRDVLDSLKYDGDWNEIVPESVMDFAFTELKKYMKVNP